MQGGVQENFEQLSAGVQKEKAVLVQKEKFYSE